MIKKGLLLPFMAFAVSTTLYAGKSTTLELTSPGGVHKVKFYGKTSASGANGLYYTVDFKDKSVDCMSITVCGKWLSERELFSSRNAGWTIWK